MGFGPSEMRIGSFLQASRLGFPFLPSYDIEVQYFFDRMSHRHVAFAGSRPDPFTTRSASKRRAASTLQASTAAPQ